MEVLMQNNDFVMFLFSEVLQMARKKFYPRNRLRALSPLPEQGKLVKSGSRGWRAQEKGLEIYIPVLALQCSLSGLGQVILYPDFVFLKIQGFPLEMRSEVSVRACSAMTFFLLLN